MKKVRDKSNNDSSWYFGEYSVQFKDSLATIIKAEDFKKMHKNDFIELHNKIKDSLHE